MGNRKRVATRKPFPSEQVVWVDRISGSTGSYWMCCTRADISVDGDTLPFFFLRAPVGRRSEDFENSMIVIRRALSLNSGYRSVWEVASD